MRASTFVFVLAIGIAAGARAQEDAANGSAFPATEAQLSQALCPPHGGCVFDFVLYVGRHRETDLAIVRVRSGPIVCCEEPGYRDYLVSLRAGSLRRERMLVRGACPCLEWERSRWYFEHGELTFEYGGMGAPPASGTDMRPLRVRARVWPLAITRAFVGDDELPDVPSFPIVLTME